MQIIVDMRKLMSALAVSLFATVAAADVPSTQATAPSPPDSVRITHGQPATSSLPPIDFDAVPDACKSIGRFTASPSPGVALSSRVSLANCIAQERMRPLSLIDCEKSVRDLEAAATPSLALLDDVIAANEPSWKIIALHAKGELLSSMSIRMLSTIPPAPAAANENAYALHDMRMSMLQNLIQPWIALSQDAFRQVERINRQQPTLAVNQTVRSAVLDSQRRIVPDLATR
jgi:hypothetical protein